METPSPSFAQIFHRAASPSNLDANLKLGRMVEGFKEVGHLIATYSLVGYVRFDREWRKDRWHRARQRAAAKERRKRHVKENDVFFVQRR